MKQYWVSLSDEECALLETVARPGESVEDTFRRVLGEARESMAKKGRVAEIKSENISPSKNTLLYLAKRLWMTSLYLYEDDEVVGVAHAAIKAANRDLIEILLGFEITEDDFVVDGGRE